MKKLLTIYIFMFGVACSYDGNRIKKTNNSITTLPPFSMLLTDSVTTINSNQIPNGSPILIMYFSPDCEHCQHETKDLINNITSLKDVRIYMLTPMSFEELKYFYNSYNLSAYRNITVGRDHKFSFLQTFKPKNIPYIVIYNGSKKLVKIYEKGAPINEIIKSARI